MGSEPDVVVGNNISYYWSETFQGWFGRLGDIAPGDWNEVAFVLSGDGNPRAQTNSGDHASEGVMWWDGLLLQFDTPAPGTTYVTDLELPDHTLRYEFSRDGMAP